MLRTIWSVSRAAKDASASSSYLAPPHPLITNASMVIGARSHASQVDRAGNLLLRATRKLQLPRTFGQLGPSLRIKIPPSEALNLRALGRFALEATSANLPKQARFPLPRMLSGYIRYVAFFEIRKVRPFPVCNDRATQRSSVFGNTAAYGSYISTMRK